MLPKCEITLQKDNEMIFQNNATARRIIVQKIDLWVPNLHFKPAWQKLVNKTFFKTYFLDLPQ